MLVLGGRYFFLFCFRAGIWRAFFLVIIGFGALIGSRTARRGRFAVIGHVKTAAFEYYADAAAYEPSYFTPAQGAIAQRIIHHALKGFECMAAMFAFIIIAWHISAPVWDTYSIISFPGYRQAAPESRVPRDEA